MDRRTNGQTNGRTKRTESREKLSACWSAE